MISNEILEKIDENIREIIIELNNKGYETMFSCGGHVGELYTEIYIVIKRNETIDSVIINIEPPDGFYINLENGQEVYSNLMKNLYDDEWLKSLTPEYFHRVLIKTTPDVCFKMRHNQDFIDLKISDLYEWVNNLPDLNSIK